ncbi:hypothetical protein NFI96_005531 [Prochilodus magdalenae]|nr:hypothetical protein NFI96_005531 [Prochilodus magdalenae]
MESSSASRHQAAWTDLPSNLQFIMALSPTELCIHKQLANPHDLLEALELILGREMVSSTASWCTDVTSPGGRAVEELPKLLWVEELTELTLQMVITATIQPVAWDSRRWTCGQPGLPACPS